MKVLVTAGNTLVPIDRVRCITNIFTGRTGTSLALHAHKRGHAVTLLTSHPEVVAELGGTGYPADRGCQLRRYRTFDDLQQQLEESILRGIPDVVIHCAAVSDYRAAGVYAPGPETCFDVETRSWASNTGAIPALVDRAAGKVKSDEPELWLRLIRTPKLVDRIRGSWGFRGILVKFKLEVGVDEEHLLRVAEQSRVQSTADVMVANTLEGEGASPWTFLGPVEGVYRRVPREELPGRLFDLVERLQAVSKRGLSP